MISRDVYRSVVETEGLLHGVSWALRKERKLRMKKFFFILILLLESSECFAYIDPGLLGGVTQIFYALIMGFVSLYIFRPLNLLRGFFCRSNWVLIKIGSLSLEKLKKSHYSKVLVLCEGKIYFYQNNQYLKKSNTEELVEFSPPIEITNIEPDVFFIKKDKRVQSLCDLSLNYLKSVR